MSQDGIPAMLCRDHFERMCNGTVCNTCPSRTENKAVTERLAQLHDEGMTQAIITEMKLLRKAQESVGKEIHSIWGDIRGNGKPGILARLIVLETQLNQSSKSTHLWIAIAGLLISSIIGLITVMIAISALT